MKGLKKIMVGFLALIMIFTVTACNPVDKDYGVESDAAPEENLQAQFKDMGENPVMSSDRVMSKYFDITLFDEENYSDVYIGKKFKIRAEFLGAPLEVPIKLSGMEEKGWHLDESNSYDGSSVVFAYETVEVVFTNDAGIKIKALVYNSSRSSVNLSECNIVKIILENNFYEDNENYNAFDINGITNTMAITDIINTLGTPSHFYEVSEESYYLDYFMTKKDRRNGITIYINPIDDSITSIEFSYYK